MQAHVTVTLSLEDGETLTNALIGLLGGAPNTAVKVEKTPIETKISEEPDEEEPAPKPKRKGAKTKAAEPAEKKAVDAPTFETVRKAASDAYNRGKRDDVNAVIRAHSADGKLSNVAEEDLAAVLQAIEAL